MGRPRNWITADVVRVADGVLAEHWDALQDEATRAELKSGLPMFGTQFREGKPTAFRSRRGAAPSISPRHASPAYKVFFAGAREDYIVLTKRRHLRSVPGLQAAGQSAPSMLCR